MVFLGNARSQPLQQSSLEDIPSDKNLVRLSWHNEG